MVDDDDLEALATNGEGRGVCIVGGFGCGPDGLDDGGHDCTIIHVGTSFYVT